MNISVMCGQWMSPFAVCVKKIEDDPGKPVYILTKRGVGYYFDC